MASAARAHLLSSLNLSSLAWFADAEPRKEDSMKWTACQARRVRQVALVLMLAAPMVSAQSSSRPEEIPGNKPAWQWTIEERLAKRFDPAEMKERAEAENRRIQELVKLGMLSAEAVSSLPLQADTDSISGRETPELFLPTELFDALLNCAFPPDGRNQEEGRAGIEERAAALGFGADLWRRLGRISSPFLEVRREHARSAISSKSERGDERLTIPLCQTRAAAMAAAKAEFGEEAFLRLLYEVVAPSLSKASRIEDRQSFEKNVKWVDGGCR